MDTETRIINKFILYEKNLSFPHEYTYFANNMHVSLKEIINTDVKIKN